MTRSTPTLGVEVKLPAIAPRNTLSGSLKAALIVTALVILGLFIPSLVSSSFYLGLMINTIVLGVAAISIGFLAHQCGLIMFGAAGFTGGATYLFGIAVTQFGWNVTAAAVFCLLAATLLSVLIGALVVRARPLPFAMLTLALAQMLRSLVMLTDFRSVTGGDDGLTMQWDGLFFGLNQAQLSRPSTFWPVAWLALCGVMLLAWVVGRSRTGQILRATRANEERMRFSGFNTYLPRVFAFALAGFIASVSGLLMALNMAFASPELLDFATGSNTLVAMLVGGSATVGGPVLGALLFVVGQDRFGASGNLELLTGISVVLVIAAFPEGMMGFIRRGLRRITGRHHVAH
ncbi:branched-chain amino acid ABC transporter permease [Glaciimonas sp. CA11.2]|uniref:branched-chain amino acid ABC transporter permease n=1 Tax=unclassified Glaciimonas TaxID=2644401 RepID=UPI002AB438CA|nr:MULTISPECIES: branched-chain amino acid ABC transporter permease [unclassified Glaciimonas]MDY7546128.1 branched-chain amino acid ABC transporter permease [Glaciimonas sp. CA11.2]MEB0010917.1 branched-chain amino acid ABC transporter permease [Glaciimonas sp. Cout2]MEB0081699.1 branched-chain amino acid ABC transporter permease [Glaciimonas sp. Gout2]MEB0161824.1 branched-chain amino acid ABC transporter permease [Glaciimonas sp. CA11.2]